MKCADDVITAYPLFSVECRDSNSISPHYIKTNSKKDFQIRKITKDEAGSILKPFHYLTNISKGFKSGINFGCFKNDELVGVAIFTGFPVPELAKGMLGLDRHEQSGLFELSRLCIEPSIQKSEHNLASWFLSRCIRTLRKETDVKVILSYADSDYHSGVVYAACNFKYYGLTAPKKDFYIQNKDGSYTKHSRGVVKGVAGEWRDRTRKHRFVMIFDSSLHIKWDERKWVKNEKITTDPAELGTTTITMS